MKEKVTNTFFKTVSAFANFGTVTMQFILSDDGKVLGIQHAKAHVLTLQIESTILSHRSPNTENHVITLTIEDGPFKPYLYKSKAYKRNDTAAIPVDRVELNRLILEREHRTYEELISAKTRFRV